MISFLLFLLVPDNIILHFCNNYRLEIFFTIYLMFFFTKKFVFDLSTPDFLIQTRHGHLNISYPVKLFLVQYLFIISNENTGKLMIKELKTKNHDCEVFLCVVEKSVKKYSVRRVLENRVWKFVNVVFFGLQVLSLEPIFFHLP